MTKKTQLFVQASSHSVGRPAIVDATKGGQHGVSKYPNCEITTNSIKFGSHSKWVFIFLLQQEDE
jgi:hypothetical protein